MMTPADYFPPWLDRDGEAKEWEPAPGLRLQRRTVTPEVITALARSLREAGVALREVRAGTLIRRLVSVHQEWARPRSPLRAQAVALLHPLTGYPAALIDRSLARMFARMDAAEMTAWLTAGGVEPEWLDPPGPRAAGRPLVFGPGLTVVVASGNIPGAAVPLVAQALLLKSPCMVKTASAEPVLLPLYARSVAEHAPELAPCLAVTGWTGGRAELEAALLAEADALVAYGGDTALRALRDRLPVRARFVGYGHRISFSAIGREWLSADRAAETAALAARDFATFDQQGCLSPQALYVERGGDTTPEAFGALLAEALAQAEVRMPLRALDPAEAAAVHQYRASIEMRALAREEMRLWSSQGGTRWTVVLETEGELEPSPLNRTAVIRPVDDLDDLPRCIAGRREHLMSAALGVGERRRARLARGLAAAGVTRVTGLGRAQELESDLYHDGVNAVALLARFARVDE